jgi:pimeloyl-ACP methyl ester carboxylesterase
MGSGPPILLFPPLGCLGLAFVYQARYLSQSHRVLMFHYPGYGRSSLGRDGDVRSMVSNIAGCLHLLVPGAACHILGWSMGGIIGQVLACERPDLVRSLMLVNTSAKLDDDGSLAGMTKIAQSFIDDFRDNKPEWMRDRLEGQFDFFRAGDCAIATSRLMAAVQAFDGRQRLGAITVPALVVAGGQDRITPARSGRDLAERLPCATYKELATGGHYVPLFNADWFNVQMAAFIDVVRS